MTKKKRIAALSMQQQLQHNFSLTKQPFLRRVIDDLTFWAKFAAILLCIALACALLFSWSILFTLSATLVAIGLLYCCNLLNLIEDHRSPVSQIDVTPQGLEIFQGTQKNTLFYHDIIALERPYRIHKGIHWFDYYNITLKQCQQRISFRGMTNESRLHNQLLTLITSINHQKVADLEASLRQQPHHELQQQISNPNNKFSIDPVSYQIIINRKRYPISEINKIILAFTINEPIPTLTIYYNNRYNQRWYYRSKADRLKLIQQLLIVKILYNIQPEFHFYAPIIVF